jgi:hypothetical protein
MPSILAPLARTKAVYTFYVFGQDDQYLLILPLFSLMIDKLTDD